MLQRIQTIWLVLAAAAGFGLLSVPLAQTSEAIESSPMFADSTFGVGDNTGLLVLFALSGALAVASIFLFKNRPLQLRVTRFAMIANILGLVLAVILLWQDVNNLEDVSITDGAGAYLPFAFVLFAILAIRAIRKDEKLVRSIDRLR